MASAALLLAMDFVAPVSGRLELLMDAGAAAALAAAGLIALRGLGSARTSDAALQRSEARLRSIVDGAGDAIIVIDDQAAITAFNRAAEQMFGFTAAEMIGTSLERLMPDHVRQAHAAYMAATGVTGMVEAVRHRSVHKGLRRNGQVFSFELSMTEWSDQGRRMFTGVMRDVTEREKARAALQESQARYTGLFETTAALLFIYRIDKEGGFTFETMNGAAEAFTGVSRAGLAGAGPDALLEPESSKRVRRGLIQCLHEGTDITVEGELALPTGPRHLLLTLSPMREASGEITRVLVVGREPSA